jgi:general secretion pathway protein K
MIRRLARLARACVNGAPGARDGFIIVATLWILVALTALASIYAVYVVNTAYAVGTAEDRPQTEAAVRAALELTAYRLTSVGPDARPSSGAFRLRIGRTNVAVDFRSEAARIDLNRGSKELLAGLFTTLGSPPARAEDYANRVIAWRTSRTSVSAAQDEETTLYRSAGRPYGPRGGPFPHVGELTLVLGPPPELIQQATPFLTVFSGQTTVNVLDAPPQVIAALPGMTPDRLLNVLNARAAGVGGNALLEMLGPARAFATIASSPAVRVTVLIRADNGRQTRSDAVILLIENAPEPYRVLAWRDAYDETVRSGQ